jgi:hypothetical protein
MKIDVEVSRGGTPSPPQAKRDDICASQPRKETVRSRSIQYLGKEPIGWIQLEVMVAVVQAKESNSPLFHRENLTCFVAIWVVIRAEKEREWNVDGSGEPVSNRSSLGGTPWWCEGTVVRSRRMLRLGGWKLA